MYIPEKKTSSLPHSSRNQEHTKPKNILAVGLGEIFWHLFPESKRLEGAPLNFAYACNALGARSAIFSQLGNDSYGAAARSILAQRQIDQSTIRTDLVHPTGTKFTTKNVDDNLTSTYPEQVAWDFLILPEDAQQFAAAIDIICFGTLAQRSVQSRNTIQTFLSMLPSSTLKIFDVNIRKNIYTEEIIRDSLVLADVVKLNTQELQIVAQATGIRPDTEHIMLQNLLHTFTLEAVALTKGTTGSTVITREKISEVTSFRVNVEDTTGAGDSFTAALALGLSLNWDLDKTHRKAAVVASYVCTQEGNLPAFPDSLKMLETT